jgi:hypothetical protein
VYGDGGGGGGDDNIKTNKQQYKKLCDTCVVSFTFPTCFIKIVVMECIIYTKKMRIPCVLYVRLYVFMYVYVGTYVHGIHCMYVVCSKSSANVTRKQTDWKIQTN